MNNKVVFVCGTSLSPFNTMLTMAKYVKDHSELEPIFIISKADFEPKFLLLEREGIKFIKLYGSSIQSAPDKSNIEIKIRQVIKGVYLELQRFSIFHLLYSWVVAKQLRKQYSKLESILNELQIQALFVPSERCRGYEMLSLKYANKNSIKTFVFPYAYTDPISRLDRRIHRQDQGFKIFKAPLLNHYFKGKYPKQIFSHNDTSRYFYPLYFTLAADSFGILPQDPWSVGGSGFVDYTCVQGQEEVDKSNKYGVNRNLYITGHPEHDELYFSSLHEDSIKQQLIRKFTLDSSKKIIIVGLPQWFENKILSREESDNNHLLLLNELNKQDVNLLISLHPKMDQVYYFSKYPQFKILEQSLSSCIAAADIYVSSFVGTALWAMLLGIPCLLMDEFDFKYQYLQGIHGIVKCDRKTFGKNICEMCSDPKYYEELQNLQKYSSKYFAKVDGKVNQRFLDLISE